jgi:hypothetical protein
MIDMKKFTLIVTLLAVFGGVSAQKNETYWVVETEGRMAKQSVVRIYDASNNLVKETTIDRLIDINKKKERRKLNRMLKQQGNDLLWSKR